MSDENAKNSAPRFETAISGLEQAVQRLESGELSLDDALACYERGLGLLLQCRRMLAEAERQVALLTGVRDDGTPETARFNASATFSPTPNSQGPAERAPATIDDKTAD